MVSNGSNRVAANELLVLVKRVASTNFMIANFVTHEKVLMMMLNLES